jgi:hypothetical protein
LVTHDGYKLVEGLIQGSGGLHLLVEPVLHLLEPFVVAGESTTFDDCYGGGTGGST